MMSVETIDAYYSCFNRGDVAGIAALFAPEGTFQDAATLGPVPRDGVRAVGEHLLALLPDLKFELGPVPRCGRNYARPR